MDYSNEDDITVKLSEIVYTNAIIKQGLSKGVPTSGLMVRICSLACSGVESNRALGTMGFPPSVYCDVHQ